MTQPKPTQIVRGWVQVPVLVTVDTRGRAKIVDVFPFFDYAHPPSGALGHPEPDLEVCSAESDDGADVRYYADDNGRVEPQSAKAWSRVALNSEKLKGWL